jgi:hypothetical protein
MFLFHSSGRPWAALTLLAASLLSGCVPVRPAPDTAAPHAALPAAYPPDSLLATSFPTADSLPPATGFIGPTGKQPGRSRRAARLPRKCKGCSFYYGPTTVATAARKATVAAAPRATATSTGRRSGPAVIAASASPLSMQRGRQVVASAPPASRTPASWGGAPRSVGRAVVLSSILTLVAAGLGWLVLAGRRRRAVR